MSASSCARLKASIAVTSTRSSPRQNRWAGPPLAGCRRQSRNLQQASCGCCAESEMDLFPAAGVDALRLARRDTQRCGHERYSSSPPKKDRATLGCQIWLDCRLDRAQDHGLESDGRRSAAPRACDAGASDRRDQLFSGYFGTFGVATDWLLSFTFIGST